MRAPEPGRVAPYIDPDEVLGAVIELFARIPGLVQKLLEKARRDIADDKPHSFFNDLFVGTSRPAVGANYHVVGYRLRNADELYVVCGATKGDFLDFDGHVVTPTCEISPKVTGGLPEHKIEITPEMIEAGLLWLYRFSHETDEREIVAEIYKAMKSVKENSCSKLHVLK